MSGGEARLEGGCTCGTVRYRLESRPFFIHCCHCHWCQRETGSAFALNALIEADRVTLLDGRPETILTPSLSGKGQEICRCHKCRVALWSHYGGMGRSVSFVRVGTLDAGHGLRPDIHIFTESRQEWVVIPAGQVSVPRYYDARQYWPAESLERFRALKGSA